MNFSASAEYCSSIDSYLPEPKTEEEYNILHNFARNKGGFGFWLGATDSADEGTYVWQSDGQVLSYDKWRPGETNREDEDCLRMNSYDGLWRYHACNDRLVCRICQKKFEGNVNVLLSSSFKTSLSHKTY